MSFNIGTTLLIWQNFSNLLQQCHLFLLFLLLISVPKLIKNQMNSCLLSVLKLKLIQIKKLKLNFRNNHKYVHISQWHFSSYYFELLLRFHLYIFCYETYRQHKKAEILDIIQVLILPCPWLRFMCLQTPATVKVKVLFSFKMISQQFCSFDNFNSLL